MHIEHVKLGTDSRFVLPATLRQSIGVKPGDTLVIESDGDSLLVRSRDAVLREDQDYFRQFAGRETVINELIADRRAEAARDEAEFADGPRG